MYHHSSTSSSWPVGKHGLMVKLCRVCNNMLPEFNNRVSRCSDPPSHVQAMLAQYLKQKLRLQLQAMDPTQLQDCILSNRRCSRGHQGRSNLKPAAMAEDSTAVTHLVAAAAAATALKSCTCPGT